MSQLYPEGPTGSVESTELSRAAAERYAQVTAAHEAQQSHEARPGPVRRTVREIRHRIAHPT